MPGYEIFNDQEKKHVNDVLNSGILMRYNFDALRNGHWKTKSFEETIQSKFNVNYAHTCCNGTSALITALTALGIGFGDEVIMPTFTFVASFEAVLSVGAIPILTNINNSLTLDINEIEKNITKNTKAIMPVHMCGAMADLDNILSIAKKYNLVVLEDACQSIGGKYKGKFLGTIGNAGTYSFDFVKTITCGEGGAIVTNDKNIYEKTHQFTDHGHDHLGSDRGAEQHPYLGLNFRMNELNAAIGLAQIDKLEKIITIQKNNHQIIKDELEKIKEISFRKIYDIDGDTNTFLSIFLPSEEIARKINIKLKEEGIDSCFYWFDNNWHYIKKWEHLKEMKVLNHISPDIKQRFQNHINNYDLSQSNKIISRTISFLIKISWTKQDVELRAKKISEIIKSFI